MRCIISLSLFLACSLACCRPTSAQDPKPAATSTSCDSPQQRQLSLNVTDKEGKFISVLRPDDLTLSVAKNPTEILKLETKLDEPLSVVILIDTSMSQSQTLPQTKLAARRFLEWVLKTKKDHAALVSFAGQATVEAGLTDDSEVLFNALRRVTIEQAPEYVVSGAARGGTPPIQPRRQGTTAMWDAIWASTDEILKPVSDSRRVIFLLTDGSDSSSLSSWRETILHAAVNDVAVFAMGVTEWKYLDLVAQKSLEDLTETTGGRMFTLKKIYDIPSILAKIEPEVRSRHVITYCSSQPQSPDSPFKLHLEPKTPSLRAARLLYRRYAP